MRLSALATAAAVALLAPAVARGGGAPVQVAAVGSTLWTVSDSGLLAVDPASGTIVARPVVPYPYPMRIAAAAGSLWVASVANGYVSGAVSRIDGRTRRASTRLRLPRQGVYDVCAGGTRAWAIVGPSRRRRIVRLEAGDGRPRFITPSSEPAWCAADAAGAWVSTGDGRLLHVDARSDAVSSSPGCSEIGQLAVGHGSVWAACQASIVRIDEATKAVHRIPLAGIPDALTVGRSGVWALVFDRAGATTLVRIAPQSDRVVLRRRLAGSPTTILETRDALWIGGLDRRQQPVLLRLDPRSLVVRRVIPLL